MADEVTDAEMELALDQSFGSLAHSQDGGEIKHFGVKGMRWGVRKKDDGGSSAGAKDGARFKPAKPTDQQIRAARSRVASSNRQLNQQFDKANLAKGEEAAKEIKTFENMAIKHFDNPDRATALRLTKGEKFGSGLLAVSLPGLGTGVAAVSVGSRVATRKLVERDLRKRAAVRPR